MDIYDSRTQFAAGGTALLLLLLVFLLVQPTMFVKWLQRKNYQYEVTFALYMLTPTEKFIFNSVLFLTLSMFLLASIIYLPNHVVQMTRRVYYYCGGEMGFSEYSLWRHLGNIAVSSNTRDAAKTGASGLANTALAASAKAAAVTQQVYHQVRDGL